MSLPKTRAREQQNGFSADGMRRVLVRDLVTKCSIGVHAHEELAKQRIRLNLELDVAEDTEPLGDRIEHVVCYDEIIGGIRRIIDEGHVRLIETLAERIAQSCLGDARVRRVRVRLEKLDVYDDVEAVGIAIERVSLLSNPS
jgi:dihydroneopterin aldolase